MAFEPLATLAPVMLDSAHTSQPIQRVPISNSMLYAYAAMRGNVHKGTHEPDPLHKSLYLNAIKFVRREYEKPIDLHFWQRQYDRFMAHEHEPGQTFFYDASVPMYRHSAPLQNSPRIEDVGESTHSFIDHIREIPLRRLPNHYKGGDGYGNYGYVEVNGHWVDPDGEIDILNAVKNQGPHVPPGLRVGNMPALKTYEEEIYSGFMTEIDENPFSDGEGDPRGLYITPAIFARLAAGVSEGDKYELAKAPAQDPPLRDFCSRKQTSEPPRRIPGPQYDRDTGSAYSAQYSLDSNPSLWMSPRGVNMTWRPDYFTYSYPQAAMDHDRAEYGGCDLEELSNERVQSWLAMPEESILVPFTEENAVKYLADPDDPDPKAGHKKLDQHRTILDTLEGEYLDLGLRTLAKHARGDSASMEAQKLHKEGVFMEHRLNKRDKEMGTPRTERSISRATTRATPSRPVLPRLRMVDESHTQCPCRSTRQEHTAGGAEPLSQLPSPSPSSESPRAAQPLRHKKPLNQFERYFEERTEQELIKVNKMKMRYANLDVSIQEIEEHIGHLRIIHGSYCASLGVGSASEIPDLIPKRKKKADPGEEMLEKLQEGWEGEGDD